MTMNIVRMLDAMMGKGESPRRCGGGRKDAVSPAGGDFEQVYDRVSADPKTTKETECVRRKKVRRLRREGEVENDKTERKEGGLRGVRDVSRKRGKGEKENVSTSMEGRFSFSDDVSSKENTSGALGAREKTTRTGKDGGSGRSLHVVEKGVSANAVPSRGVEGTADARGPRGEGSEGRADVSVVGKVRLSSAGVEKSATGKAVSGTVHASTQGRGERSRTSASAEGGDRKAAELPEGRMMDVRRGESSVQRRMPIAGVVGPKEGGGVTPVRFFPGERPLASRKTLPSADATEADLHIPFLPGKGERARVPAGTVAPRLASLVHVHARYLHEGEKKTVEVSLHPPHLGRMRLHVAVERGRLQVRIEVEHQEVREMLRSELPQLQRALRALQPGGGGEVDVTDLSARGGAQGNHAGEESGKRSEGNVGVEDVPTGTGVDEESSAGYAVYAWNRVNLLA